MEISVSDVRVGDRRTFTGIVRDVTDVKQTREQLLQSERLAAIGQMVTGLAHESRNAFQRSQACLEMLAMEVEDRPEALGLVARIQEALEHVHYLYEEVRNYAAPLKLSLEACDLQDLWLETWAHLEVMRTAKDIRLREEIACPNLYCVVDRHAIEQLFRNVLENAIDASPDGEEILIRCTDTRLRDQPAVRINICDRGPGLCGEARRRIFEPFFTTKTRGTGLGMAIAQRIAQAHAGQICVADSDQGADIAVTLPRDGP
jgi:signal transduction histidine kinase